MANDENLRTLLEAAATDDSAESCLLLLEALVELPLSDADWLAIGACLNVDALLRALLADPARATGAPLDAWQALLARVPLVSVRLRLRAFAQQRGLERSLSAARALAAQRDDSGLSVLLADFVDGPNAWTAWALAQLSAESLRASQGVLSLGLSASDPMVRLWSAIALAKAQVLDEPRSARQTLEWLWESSVRMPDGGKQGPALFWGNPRAAVAALSSVRPLPPELNDSLLSLKARDFDDDWRPRHADRDASAQNARQLVAGLTRAYDVDGDSVPAAGVQRDLDRSSLPANAAEALRIADRLMRGAWDLGPQGGYGASIPLDNDQRLQLRALPEKVAAQLVHSVLDDVERSAVAGARAAPFHVPQAAGNALLMLVSALPAPLPLDLDRVLDDGALLAQRVTRRALAWTLARAGLDRVLTTLTTRIVASSGEQRRKELTWLRDIAAEWDASPTYSGAGGEALAREPRPLIVDDAMLDALRPPEMLRASEPEPKGFRAAAPTPVGAAPQPASPGPVEPLLAHLGAAERGPSPVEPAAGGDLVDVAVFCPEQVARGDSFLVQVYLYPPPSEAEVALEAQQADESARRRGKLSLPLELPHGTRVDLHLEMPALTLAEPDAVVIWRGRSTSAQFDVTVPATATAASAIGRVRIAVAGLPSAMLRFVVKLLVAGAGPQPIEPREVRARRYRNAFVSYSSVDRAEVLRRVQAFRIAGLSVFQDILELEPGERWERSLYRRIDECDVFLLFWSRAAAASPWVSREIEYALARKANNDENPPDIQPVPLEGPPPVPPPPGLSSLHFNDALLAHIRAADQLASTPRG